MTGNELARQLKTVKGKLYAYVSFVDDGAYLPVEKAALLHWLNGAGDSETGMKIDQHPDCAYLEANYI